MVRDHDEQDVGGRGGVAGCVGGGGALGDEPEEGRGVDVVAGDGEAGAQEVGGHAETHCAEAGEEDGGRAVGRGGHGGELVFSGDTRKVMGKG